MTRLHPLVLAAPLALFVLAGCANEPYDPTPVASTRSRECKVVAANSASEVLHYEVHRSPPNDDPLAQAEGTAGVGRLQQPGRTPRVLREPAGIGKLELAMRDC